MVVHISADRSSATVMSIPRDLETALPACTDSQNRCRLEARPDLPRQRHHPSAADTKAALANAHAQAANDTKGCAQVSTYDDVVTLPGHGSMSPTRAYALSPTVPDSAP